VSNKFEIIGPGGAVFHGIRIGAGIWLITARHGNATKKMKFRDDEVVELLKWSGQDEHFIRRIIENLD
jgi:hypothetical protein